MASSPVEIANLALSRIGQKTIASLDDSVPSAQLSKLNYNPARQATLRGFDWAFASTRAKLPALSTAPAWGYARAFQLPADCLWVPEADVDVAKTPWKVEGRAIVTDASAPLGIRYIRDEEDTTKFDSLFVDALTDQLAGEIVFGLTKNIGYRDKFFQSALIKIANARSVDSQQGSASIPDSDSLILVRR